MGEKSLFFVFAFQFQEKQQNWDENSRDQNKEKYPKLDDEEILFWIRLLYTDVYRVI